MIKNLLSITFLALLLFGCSSSKKTQTKGTILDLKQIEIGTNQTGIIGKVLDFSTNENDSFLNIAVENTKPGGANAPAPSKSSNINISITPSFLRQYQDLNGKDLFNQLEKNQKVLVIISQNQLKKTINLVQITF